VVLVVLVDEVPKNRETLPAFQSVMGARWHGADNKHLPNDEVVVMVVDNGWDATVGVDLQEFWSLLFLLAEVEVHRLVGQPEFFKNDGDFPRGRTGFQIPE